MAVIERYRTTIGGGPMVHFQDYGTKSICIYLHSSNIYIYMYIHVHICIYIFYK